MTKYFGMHFNLISLERELSRQLFFYVYYFYLRSKSFRSRKYQQRDQFIHSIIHSSIGIIKSDQL